MINHWLLSLLPLRNAPCRQAICPLPATTPALTFFPSFSIRVLGGGSVGGLGRLGGGEEGGLGGLGRLGGLGDNGGDTIDSDTTCEGDNDVTWEGDKDFAEVGDNEAN